MENVASLTHIHIKDEETLINTNSLKNNSLVDEGLFVNFFEKEHIAYVILLYTE